MHIPSIQKQNEALELAVAMRETIATAALCHKHLSNPEFVHYEHLKKASSTGTFKHVGLHLQTQMNPVFRFKKHT